MSLRQRLPTSLNGLELGPLLRRGFAMVQWRLGALVLSLGGSVWAVRCLGPESLGVAAFVLAGVQQVLLLASLLPEQYLVRDYKNTPASASCRLDLIRLAITIRLSFGLLLGVAVLATVLGLGRWDKWAGSLWAGLPVLVVLALNISWLLQAQEKQAALYKTQFVQALFLLVAMLAVMRPGTSPVVYLLIHGLSGALGTVLIFRYAAIPRGAGLPDLKLLRGLPAAFRRAWAVYLIGLLIYLYTAFELPLVGFLVSVEELGLYRSAHTLVGVLQSFAVVVPLILYPRFIEWRKQGVGVLWRRQLLLFGVFAVVGGVVSLGAFVLSPVVYPWIYGEAFGEAARPFAILVSSKMVVLLNGIFGWGLLSHGKDRAYLVVVLVTAAFSVTANLYFVPEYGMLAAAWVNLCAELLILLGAFLYSLRLIQDESV